jgi:sulfur carrier protein ThiS
MAIEKSCDINDTSKACEQIVDQGPAPDESRTELMNTFPVRAAGKESVEIADRVDHAEHDSPDLANIITSPNPHATTYVDIPDDAIVSESPELTPHATLQRKNDAPLVDRIVGKGKAAAEGEVSIRPAIPYHEGGEVDIRNPIPYHEGGEVDTTSIPSIKLENEIFFNTGRQNKSSEINIIGNREQRAGMTLDIAGLSQRNYKGLNLTQEPGGRKDQKDWNFLDDHIHDPPDKSRKPLEELTPKTDVRAQEIVEIEPAGIDVRSFAAIEINAPQSIKDPPEVSINVPNNYDEPAKENDFERDLPIREDSFIDDIEAKFDIRSDAALEFYAPFTPQLFENGYEGGIALGDIYRNKDAADGQPVNNQDDLLEFQNSDYSAFESIRDASVWIQPSAEDMPLADIIPKLEPVLTSKVVGHEGNYEFQDLINALYYDDEGNDILGGQREGLRYNDSGIVETSTNWYFNVRIEGYDKASDILVAVNKHLAEDEGPDPIIVVKSSKPESNDMAQYNARIDYTLPEYTEDGKANNFSSRDMANYIQPSAMTMPLAEVVPKMDGVLSSKAVDHEGNYEFQDLINALYVDEENDIIGGQREGLRFNDSAIVESNVNWFYSIRIEGYNKETQVLTAVNKYLSEDEEADPINIVTSIKPESWDMAQYNARIDYTLPEYDDTGKPNHMSPRDMANYISPSEFTMPLAELTPKQEPVLSSKVVGHDPTSPYHFQDLINSLYVDEENDIIGGQREGLRFNDSAIVEVNTNWYFSVRIEGYNKAEDTLSAINKYLAEDDTVADPINVVVSIKPESWDMAQYNARIDYTLPEYTEDGKHLYMSSRDMNNYIQPSQFTMPLAELNPKMDPVVSSKAVGHEGNYEFQDLINALYVDRETETDIIGGSREGLRFNDSAIVEVNTNWYFTVRIEGYNKENDILSAVNKYMVDDKEAADPINIVTSVKPESWDQAQYNARIDYTLPEYSPEGVITSWSPRDMANYINPDEFTMPLATIVPKMDPVMTSKVTNHDPESPYHFQDLINSLYFSGKETIVKYNGQILDLPEVDLLGGLREGMRFNDSAIVEANSNWYYSIRIEGYNKAEDTLSAVNKHYSQENELTPDKINIVTSIKPESWDQAQYNARIDYTLPEYNEDGLPLFWSPRDMANYINPDEFTMPLATLVPKMDPVVSSKAVGHDKESPYHFQDLINALYYSTGDVIKKYDGTTLTLDETDIIGGAREGLRFNDSAIVETSTNWYFSVRIEGYNKEEDTLSAVNKYYSKEDESTPDKINIVTSKKPESFDQAQYNARIDYTLPEYNESGAPLFWSPRDMANYVTPSEFSMPLATLVPKMDPVLSSKVVGHDPESPYHFQDLINALYYTAGDTVVKYNGEILSLEANDIIGGQREGLRFNDSAIVETNTNWYFTVRIEGYDKNSGILSAVNKHYSEEKADTPDKINIVTSKKPESWDQAQYNARIDYTLPEYNDSGKPRFWSPRDMANYITPDEFTMPLATLVPKMEPTTTSKVVGHEDPYHFQDLINSLYYTTGDIVKNYDGTETVLKETDLLAGLREGMRFNDSAIVEENSNWYYSIRIEGYDKTNDTLSAVNKYLSKEDLWTVDKINIVTSVKPESWDQAQYNARIDYTLPEYSENGSPIFLSPRDMANYVTPSEFTMPLATVVPKMDPTVSSKAVNHEGNYNFQDLINSLYYTTGDVVKKYDGTTLTLDETDIIGGQREGLRFNDSAIVETTTNWYYNVRIEGYDRTKDILSAINKYYSKEKADTPDKINIVTSVKPESWDQAQYNARIDYTLDEYNTNGKPLFWSPRDMANYINPSQFTMPLATLVPKMDPTVSSKVVGHEGYYNFQDLINSLYYTTGETIKKYDGTSSVLTETDIIGGQREGLRYNDSAIVETTTNWYYNVRIEGYNKEDDTLSAINKHYKDEVLKTLDSTSGLAAVVPDKINIVVSNKPESWDMAQYNARIDYTLPEKDDSGKPVFWSPRDMANYIKPSEFTMALSTYNPKQDPVAYLRNTLRSNLISANKGIAPVVPVNKTTLDDYIMWSEVGEGMTFQELSNLAYFRNDDSPNIKNAYGDVIQWTGDDRTGNINYLKGNRQTKNVLTKSEFKGAEKSDGRGLLPSGVNIPVIGSFLGIAENYGHNEYKFTNPKYKDHGKEVSGSIDSNGNIPNEIPWSRDIVSNSYSEEAWNLMLRNILDGMGIGSTIVTLSSSVENVMSIFTDPAGFFKNVGSEINLNQGSFSSALRSLVVNDVAGILAKQMMNGDILGKDEDSRFPAFTSAMGGIKKVIDGINGAAEAVGAIFNHPGYLISGLLNGSGLTFGQAFVGTLGSNPIIPVNEYIHGHGGKAPGILGGITLKGADKRTIGSSFAAQYEQWSFKAESAGKKEKGLSNTYNKDQIVAELFNVKVPSASEEASKNPLDRAREEIEKGKDAINDLFKADLKKISEELKISANTAFRTLIAPYGVPSEISLQPFDESDFNKAIARVNETIKLAVTDNDQALGSYMDTGAYLQDIDQLDQILRLYDNNLDSLDNTRKELEKKALEDRNNSISAFRKSPPLTVAYNILSNRGISRSSRALYGTLKPFSTTDLAIFKAGDNGLLDPNVAAIRLDVINRDIANPRDFIGLANNHEQTNENGTRVVQNHSFVFKNTDINISYLSPMENAATTIDEHSERLGIADSGAKTIRDGKPMWSLDWNIFGDATFRHQITSIRSAPYIGESEINEEFEKNDYNFFKYLSPTLLGKSTIIQPNVGDPRADPHEIDNSKDSIGSIKIMKDVEITNENGLCSYGGGKIAFLKVNKGSVHFQPGDGILPSGIDSNPDYNSDKLEDGTSPLYKFRVNNIFHKAVLSDNEMLKLVHKKKTTLESNNDHNLTSESGQSIENARNTENVDKVKNAKDLRDAGYVDGPLPGADSNFLA